MLKFTNSKNHNPLLATLNPFLTFFSLSDDPFLNIFKYPLLHFLLNCAHNLQKSPSNTYISNFRVNFAKNLIFQIFDGFRQILKILRILGNLRIFQFLRNSWILEIHSFVRFLWFLRSWRCFEFLRFLVVFRSILSFLGAGIGIFEDGVGFSFWRTHWL